jgi:Domain of unknown function (DUF4037)
VQSTHLHLTQRIADLFGSLPSVEAVALAGSHASGSRTSDSESDTDLYVYTRGGIALEARHAIVEQTGGASQSSLDLNYWGQSDEWLNAPSGIEIDVVYFNAGWLEDQIARVVETHQASLGYTTCFWHTVSKSIVFSDPHGWFARLQEKCKVEYPEALRQNIVALNRSVLRGIIPAYENQLAKAAKRRDLVSINHRLAALLASYFDIIFAVNRLLHPGEKRLMGWALANCDSLPSEMETDIASILLMTDEDVSTLPSRVTRLLDHLDQFLEKEGFGSDSH